MNEPNNVNQGPSTPPQLKQINPYSDGRAVNLLIKRQNINVPNIETSKLQIAENGEMLLKANEKIEKASFGVDN